MPRDGSGQYDLVYNWNDDKTNGIKVLASRMQTQDQDMATALSGSVSADGQTTLTGNLDFNNNKATGLANGTNAGDSINVSQAQTGQLEYYGLSSTISAGTDGEDYVVAANATLAAYPVFTRFSFLCHFNCIDDPILKIDDLATKTLVKDDNAGGFIALREGDLLADKEYEIIYNEDISTSQMVVLNPEVSGKTATTTVIGSSYLPNQITVSVGTDADHDIDFTAGNFQFDDGSGQAIADALTKQIDNTWAVGTNAGGLFSGTVANNTVYYAFSIYNPTTGVSDAGFDSDSSGANAPSGYTELTLQGTVLTDGSANIRSLGKARASIVDLYSTGSISDTAVAGSMFANVNGVLRELVVQYGIGTAGSGFKTETLPVAFKEKFLYVYVMNEGTGTGVFRSFNIEILSLTQFKYESISAASTDVRWVAMGY